MRGDAGAWLGYGDGKGTPDGAEAQSPDGRLYNQDEAAVEGFRGFEMNAMGRAIDQGKSTKAKTRLQGQGGRLLDNLTRLFDVSAWRHAGRPLSNAVGWPSVAELGNGQGAEASAVGGSGRTIPNPDTVCSWRLRWMRCRSLWSAVDARWTLSGWESQDAR